MKVQQTFDCEKNIARATEQFERITGYVRGGAQDQDACAVERRPPGKCGCLLFVATVLTLMIGTAFGELAAFEKDEVLDIDWPRTLLTYPVSFKPGQAMPGHIRLIDADGNEYPCQFWRVLRHADGSIASGRLSFFAELAPEGKYRYRLLAERAAPAADAPKVEQNERFLEIDNGQVAVRLPPEGRLRYDAPPSLNDVPGPFLGVRLLDGRWTGSSCFRGENVPRVVELESRVVEQGPLFVDATVRYAFDNGGFYQFGVRVQSGDAVVRIDEQSDSKIVGDMWRWQVIFSLACDAWRPDAAYDLGAGHRESYLQRLAPDRISDSRVDTALATHGLDKPLLRKPHTSSAWLAYGKPMTRIAELHSWYNYGNAYYIGFVEAGALVADPAALPKHGQISGEQSEPKPAPADPRNTPALVVMTMHAGTWRGASNEYEGMLFTQDDGQLALHWPLMASPHPRSHLHTQEHDTELPLSFRRRLWAFIAGPFQNHEQLYRFRETEGYITLDQYKDWILDWPQDDTISYPRLVFTKEFVEKWKGRLDQHPAGEELSKFLEFNDTEQRREFLWKQLTSRSYACSPMAHFRWVFRGEDLGWTAGMRQAQYAGWVHSADELLSSPQLSVERRRLLRQQIAAICYLFAEPDMIPRGSLIRLHNPNMHINRAFPLAYACALIPDHPQAREWLKTSAEAYVRYQAIRNISPSGGWSELVSYFAAGCPTLMHAAIVMQNAGLIDDETARLVASPGVFLLQLLTPPDPRFGCRIIPAWGHEGVYLYNHWTKAAALVRRSDPDLAKALVWGWDQQNRPSDPATAHDDGFTARTIIHADLLNDIGEGYLPPQLKSAWMPGFGAVLRAHAGGAAETYMSYRASYQLRGCASQNDFVIYSKGAPLVPMSSAQYAAHHGQISELYRTFGWHNRLRFASRDNWKGWPGGGIAAQVHAHSFSDSVDYLRSQGDHFLAEPKYERDFADYLRPDINRDYQRWTRQILFLKGRRAGGPSYFVFRESVHTPDGQAAPAQQKWWSLRTFGPKELVSANDRGFRYTGPYKAGLDVSFIEPSTVQMESRDASAAFSIQFDALENWKKAQGNDAPLQETIAVTSVGPFTPEQDLLIAVCPFAQGEPLPQYSPLAEGVAKIATGESEDYVFAGRATVNYKDGDVAFTGRAGAVRVYPEEVHLVVCEGPGKVSYRGASLYSEVPAVRVLPRQPWREQAIKVPPPKTSISFELVPGRGPINELQPGVRRQILRDGFAFAFESDRTMRFSEGGITFVGRRGGIEVNAARNTAQMVILDGESAAVDDMHLWAIEGQAGPCDLLFERDRIIGKTGGLGRFLYISAPPGVNQLPELSIDGRSYAPGTSWGFIPPTIWDPSYYIPDQPFDRRLTDMTIIVPVLEGEHRVELLNQHQPPVAKNWQRW